MVNRANFYQKIKANGLFSKLKQSQVDGMEAILNEYELWVNKGWVDDDRRKLAYIFATAYHEVAQTMQPIKEYGGDSYFIKRYWHNKKIANELGNKSAEDAVNFCGKGLVQLTGRRNYTKMGKLLNLDLVNNPDLAMDTKVAVEIMFEGMCSGVSGGGDFTSKQLNNYFNKTTDDPYNARKIINGLDKAKLISTYHYKFLEALK